MTDLPLAAVLRHLRLSPYTDQSVTKYKDWYRRRRAWRNLPSFVCDYVCVYLVAASLGGFVAGLLGMTVSGFLRRPSPFVFPFLTVLSVVTAATGAWLMSMQDAGRIPRYTGDWTLLDVMTTTVFRDFAGYIAAYTVVDHYLRPMAIPEQVQRLMRMVVDELPLASFVADVYQEGGQCSNPFLVVCYGDERYYLASW